MKVCNYCGETVCECDEIFTTKKEFSKNKNKSVRITASDIHKAEKSLEKRQYENMIESRSTVLEFMYKMINQNKRNFFSTSTHKFINLDLSASATELVTEDFDFYYNELLNSGFELQNTEVNYLPKYTIFLYEEEEPEEKSLLDQLKDMLSW